MSQTDPFDPALKALLDADRAPPLAPDFAARVLAATEARAPALPPLRRAPASRWRSARRVALGLGAGLLLSSAAAATGVLQQVGIVLPQPVQKIVDDVAQKVTGRPPAAAPVVAPAPSTPAPQLVQGPIDTPEELDTVFSHADERRPERVAARRAVVDQRIDRELERRRAAGLPVPSAEQEAALRQRLADARSRREAEGDLRREALREELHQSVEQGQPLTRETLRQAREEAGLAPAPRFSPEQRAALRQRLAERRGLAAPPTPEVSPDAEIVP